MASNEHAASINPMKTISSKGWVKTAIFAIATLVLFYFLPRSNERHFNYEVNRPWAYSLLTAPFDIPVQRDSLSLQQLRDSIDAAFIPVYKRIDEPKAKLLETVKSAAELSQAEKARLVSVIDRIYNAGVVNQSTWTLIADGKLPQVRFIDNSIATTSPTAGLLSQRMAYEEIDKAFADSHIKKAIQSIKLSSLLNPNVVPDTVGTKRLHDEKLRRAMAPIGVIQNGERIINKGDIVTPQLYTVLKTYESMAAAGATESRSARYLTWVGQLAFIMVLMSALFCYLAMFRRRIFDSARALVCVVALIVAFYILAAVCHNVMPGAFYIIPFAILSIVLGVFFDLRTATYCLLLEILLCTPLSPFPLEFAFIEFIAGIAAIYSLREFSRRSQLVRSAALVFVAYTVSYAALELMLNGDLSVVSVRVIGYFAINAVLTSFAYLFIFILEKLFGYTSVVSLVELSDINNPVLRELSEECPGTFQHSMAVSNLASEAALRIGANVQLVRTGALYHDIGKIDNPAFFTENQHGVNPHDALDPVQSAKIVIRHVPDGLRRADKAKLPQVIKDFIAQHHGEGKAKYFYNTYCNQHQEEDVDPQPFTYPGPNPQTREASIMMMADAVEAASRSLKDYSEKSIADLVNRIIDGQIADGLHNDSPISFRDITTIKDAFIRRLRTIYHARVSYPADPKKP